LRPPVGGGDEAEASIVMPGSEGPGQSHAGEIATAIMDRLRLRELFGLGICTPPQHAGQKLATYL
jgi:hypothetical protein